MKQLFFTISVITILLVIFSIILVTFWLTYPYVPLVFNTPKFVVLNPNKTVQRGELIKYISDYCKNMELPALVSRSFANEIIFSTPEMTTNRVTGCHKIVVGVPVPKELPAGEFHLENVYKYQVNPLRVITIIEETENFTVTE